LIKREREVKKSERGFAFCELNMNIQIYPVCKLGEPGDNSKFHNFKVLAVKLLEEFKFI
jgi:uncharacterized iron-regulated protein